MREAEASIPLVATFSEHKTSSPFNRPRYRVPVSRLFVLKLQGFSPTHCKLAILLLVFSDTSNGEFSVH